MTEEEWLKSAETIPMLQYIDAKVSDRKMQLLAVGCCRRIWHRIFDQRSHAAVKMTERFIEGRISAEELKAASDQCEALHTERGRVWGDGAGESAAWQTSLAPE